MFLLKNLKQAKLKHSLKYKFESRGLCICFLLGSPRN